MLSAPLETDLNAVNVTLNMHNIAVPPHSSCLCSDVQLGGGDPKFNKTVNHCSFIKKRVHGAE